MGSNLTAMDFTQGLSDRLLLQLCSAGGSMELEQLRQTLGLSSQQLDRLLEVEEGRSLVVRVREGGQKLVVYRNAVRVCVQKPKCTGDCGKLHLCRYYILGNCSRSPCKFNHIVKTPHNLLVLQEHHLESVGIGELRQLLLQNDPSFLPDVCLHYNRGDGPYGSCTYKSNCNKLHVCQHYLQGDCKFGGNCKRSHNLNDGETLKKLTKWGISSSLLPTLLGTYINASSLQNSVPPPPKYDAKSPEKKAVTPGPSKAETQQHIEEICLYFIRNTCSFKDKCVREHFHLPYRWQFCVSGIWKDMENMEDIEKSYSDPNSRIVPVHLNFDKMTFKHCKVKRLSTPSSVSKPPHYILTTDWRWYWLDEFNKWIEYGAENDLHPSSTMNSSDLERVYVAEDTADVKFQAGKQEYLLSFKEMDQKNLRYNTRRKVCRRPVFVSAEDVIKKRSSKPEATKESKSIPPYWDKGQIPSVGYKLVPLPQSSEEYSKIEVMFCRTLKNMQIHSIHRIQNPALWEVYQWQKDQMKKANGGKEPDERQLFHGTSDKLTDAICQQNFDWRICGSHGTLYGKGSYFARDSSYSHNYSKHHASQTLIMFVARVLVGDFVCGKSTYLRPPSKSLQQFSHFYDSCVDNEGNPAIFVVFEKLQIYPEYIIKYSENNQDTLLHVRRRRRI
ncbi:hypothetical protein GDO86_005064 [Hymenochirus boettgeri]|uniref:Uncharacterized protein n=1 Tax=Hymenochirus boettgeri TaxID=247094 RepID=A0A8T2J8G9_9PIPI|nr:hypothetical protein GDO86_005064 [Hymenochirus boettgeri]